MAIFRKILIVGSGARCVSLPRKFCRERGIGKGDYVKMEIVGDFIKLEPMKGTAEIPEIRQPVEVQEPAEAVNGSIMDCPEIEYIEDEQWPE